VFDYIIRQAGTCPKCQEMSQNQIFEKTPWIESKRSNSIPVYKLRKHQVVEEWHNRVAH